MRHVLARLLERNGFEVVEAGGGRDALARLRSASFDLLLTDCSMPDL
ncbi:MAG: response regulator [bacterium]|nr:response regulator [bacterium]